MADADFVISSKRKIREGEVAANKANSEAVNQILAGNINSFIDGDYKVIEHVVHGYFSSAAIFQAAPIYIPITVDVIRYELSVLDSGTSGTCSVNFNVYDDSYAFIDNLFDAGDTPRIVAANGTCTIGRDVIEAADYKVESVAHSTDTGTLNFATLTSGSVIRGYISGFSNSARSIRLKLYVREQ